MSDNQSRKKAIQKKLDSIKSSNKNEWSISDWAKRIHGGDKLALSKGITLIESENPKDYERKEDLIEACMSYGSDSFRMGITGVPGVGKSTFIESFGKEVLKNGHKLAVLAIDPSSNVSGGSILGDKTRMEELSQRDEVFIRPSAAGKSLGGVARATREAIILCEAAGYDFIVIETVGVGQSETIVKEMVDFFLLLMLSGAGDDLQGIKRGIMEMADALYISKADGDNLKLAKKALSNYKVALHLFPPNENNWIPKLGYCSSIEKENLDEIYGITQEYLRHTKANGSFDKNRTTQNLNWMLDSFKTQLWEKSFAKPEVKNELEKLKEKVANGEISPFKAAEILVSLSHE